MPSSLRPVKTVTEDATWPLSKGAPVQLRFETEIGEQIVEGMHWHTPRHLHVSLAQPTSAPLPKVDCMPAPPGNKVQEGHVIPPVGCDGTTPIGRVACFFSTREADDSVFDVDGDGHVVRSTLGKP